MKSTYERKKLVRMAFAEAGKDGRLQDWSLEIVQTPTLTTVSLAVEVIKDVGGLEVRRIVL